MLAIPRCLVVSIRSRLFEAGERVAFRHQRIVLGFQSAPASLRRENQFFNELGYRYVVSIRSRLFEAGELNECALVKLGAIVSIRSRLFEAGEPQR